MSDDDMAELTHDYSLPEEDEDHRDLGDEVAELQSSDSSRATRGRRAH